MNITEYRKTTRGGKQKMFKCGSYILKANNFLKSVTITFDHAIRALNRLNFAWAFQMKKKSNFLGNFYSDFGET